MKVEIAFDPELTRLLSFQDPFPKETKCNYCKGMARLGFVAYEHDEKSIRAGGKYVCQLYENDPGREGFWPHDACSVAVYFCRKCLKPTALYNQA